MQFDLRKSATDAAYIAVGVGVLGYQQAQVRRREAQAKLQSLGTDARGTLSQQTGTIRARAEGIATNVTGTITNAATTAATTTNPRQFVEPVVGDLRGRVEPIVQQIKTHPAVNAIPGQIGKAIDVGRDRVQGRGTS
jgi:hypothetical protein